jgi:hypothetical protein
MYNVYITNQFQTTSAQGGRGVKSVSRFDCELHRRKTLKTFVPITSKNSASDLFLSFPGLSSPDFDHVIA